MELAATLAIPIVAVTVLLLAVYLLRYRHQPPDRYVPAASWLRAGIYFCACYLLAIASGVFDALLSEPVATPEQVADAGWWAWVAGLVLLVTAAYWGIWARFTLRFDRRLQVIPQVAFGLLWGVAAGVLFLSFYHLAEAVGN